MQTIGVFYGGKSCEHEVSVITAVSVMEQLKDDYQVIPVYMCDKGWYTGELLKDINYYKNFNEKEHIPIFLDGKSIKTRGFFGIIKEYARLDVAFVCAHGGAGEGGGLSGLFELMDIPYTCCDVLQSAVCLDKEYFKIIAKQKGFKVVSGTCLKKGCDLSTKALARIIKKYGEDLIVKPVNLGSSVGVSAVQGVEELKEGISLAFAYSDRAIVEKRITPLIEYNCAAMKINGEIIVSAIEKPKAKGDILSYVDKYMQGEKSKPEYKPKSLSYNLANKIRKTTQRLYSEFNLSGVVRIDYIYDEVNCELYINEVNTVPGSMSCGLFNECGINGAMQFSALIDEAIAKYQSDKEFISHYSSELLSGDYTLSKS